VLVNLIANAADAIEESGIIDVICTWTGQDVIIKVSDNGSGIPEDILKDIFNPFFTTKLHEGGSGLGLYIVYNEVQKMGGTITAESTVGEGTTFTMTLPDQRPSI
ncbi:MAG: HAMP domain-containing histidine kinase, partial [Firmicutes bacterium]|nr:HAMP domain-containing histidine kinase [Bacillota bacterium]